MRASGLAQANVSRQLQTLAKAGILSRRRDGIKVIYGIADPGIFTLCNQVCGSLQRRLAQHAKSFAEL
jgi:ArsR family transcriptional regulator